jgi:hypothetical protein
LKNKGERNERHSNAYALLREKTVVVYNDNFGSDVFIRIRVGEVCSMPESS